jgi:hypothetical protein
MWGGEEGNRPQGAVTERPWGLPPRPSNCRPGLHGLKAFPTPLPRGIACSGVDRG